MSVSQTEALCAHYQRQALSDDPAVRAVAAERLAWLHADDRPARDNGAAAPDTDLPALAARHLGTVYQCTDGSYESGCPTRHSSKSGRCVHIWRDEGDAWVWYCRSCRR